MSLKKLAFPIFVIVIVFLGVFSVRPAILSVLEKRDELDAKNLELQGVLRTKQNLDALYAARESYLGGERGRMVYDYLPVSVNQDRIVDTFNYYAAQSGSTINKIAFSEKAAVSPFAIMNESGGTGDATTGTVSDIPTLPKTSSFTMSADIQGSYESIRSFLTAVSHSGRSYKLASFSIEKKASIGTDANGQPLLDPKMLSGNFSAEFFYLPEKQYPKGYLLPVFSGSDFDLGSIDDLISKEKAVQALTEPESAGRGNPFVL